MMERRIREKDFILITDAVKDKYLQIGEVVKVKYYPHSDDVELYIVQFRDGIRAYDASLPDICQVLMFNN